MTDGERQDDRGRFRRDEGPRTSVPEETLKSAEVVIERKTFVFTLKENSRGCFLRITEEAGQRRDKIIVPSSGLAEFRRVLDEMVKAAAPSAKEHQP